MQILPQLFKGKLTPYQISTATDIDIATIESLFEDEAAVSSLDEETYLTLKQLEDELFSNEHRTGETSA
ncbi:hypothetical protein [Macrococcoides canis]|uniref:Uncharacterized protein n=1 Tax=Macrococcoides canis TaxID=1855823 RepID=A0A4R6C7Y1_9STAP|nr:hypothetical protein [Macrococcus canis]MEE1107907.1 hypothetical protein [Macrococcus canis]TDM18594.1 hypothetical protein ETI04_03640 [Macrococcus canis]TDM21361.1 hypothetical protein ETI05_01070 [Macrococcus canis]TDM23811.1 hypothetical protein ETI02_05275 [Macrococcus canis]TDM31497.1 hypothetical protein ETI03_04040 [Macrococcus canis]